ncbi:hypothetical protein LguiA_003687 [Lonicera macranthoides]
MEDNSSSKSNNNKSSSSSINLDAAKAERSVWMMKCPLVVAKSWNSHTSAADSQPLSKVVVSLDPLRPEDPNSLQFTMEMAGNEVGNMPKSYSLNMFKDIVPMCVFSEANQGHLPGYVGSFYNSQEVQREIYLCGVLVGRAAIEGKVEHKFDMKPNTQNMEEYSRMCRERTNKSMIKNRQIQVIDNDRGMNMRPMPGMIGLIASNSKEKKRTAAPVKAPEVKRTRRDRGELEDIMFKLFERQPNWALKQLVQETDQPAQFLKEILNELCVYNKRGAHQGTYELKPEYKKSVEDTGAE